MNRPDLLASARQSGYAYPRAIDLAARLTATEDVQQAKATLMRKRDQLSRSENWCGRAFIASVLLGAVTVLVLLLAQVWTQNPFIENEVANDVFGYAVLAICFVGVVSGSAGINASTRQAELKAQLACLKPVVNSDECKTAMEFVQSGFPEVVAWRDLAIAEREELSVFDVEVMRCLYYLGIADRQKKERQAANEQACRELYCIEGSSAAATVQACA